MHNPIHLKIDGMSCQHCVQAVQDALLGVPGVENVVVDLEAGLATLHAPENLDTELLVHAIEEAEFTATLA